MFVKVIVQRLRAQWSRTTMTCTPELLQVAAQRICVVPCQGQQLDDPRRCVRCPADSANRFQAADITWKAVNSGPTCRELNISLITVHQIVNRQVDPHTETQPVLCHKDLFAMIE